jgi:hypothetical protein
MASLHGGSSAGKSDLCCGHSLDVVGRPGLHQSGLMSICFAGCLSLGPRKNDLTIYWALGPFVRSFTLLVDPGDIYPPHFGRGTPILPAVVASPTPGVVASAHLLVEVGSTVAVVVLVAEATRGRRRCVARASGMDRGFPHESGSRDAMLRGVPLPSGGRAFGPSDRGILQEILDLSMDTSPFGGRWFRHRAE